MNHFLRQALFFCIVRPFVLIVIGLNVRHRERLPNDGPAIIIANHNSHIDTLALMTLFSPSRLRLLRPVAAADYFLRNRLLAWFALRIIGIIPIARGGISAREDPLKPCAEALERGEILILFPEGTRGEAEKMSGFKSGVARLAMRYPKVPLFPVFLHGFGKVLPKGEAVLVPFFCDIFVGEKTFFKGNRKEFVQELDARMRELASEGSFASWT